jgi:hypothetical protein
MISPIIVSQRESRAAVDTDLFLRFISIAQGTNATKKPRHPEVSIRYEQKKLSAGDVRKGFKTEERGSLRSFGRRRWR